MNQLKKEKEQLVIQYENNESQLKKMYELKENEMNAKMNGLNKQIEELTKRNEEQQEVNDTNEAEINSLRN